MVYLQSFTMPTAGDEEDFFINNPKAKRTCYDSKYPFGIFRYRELPELFFDDITVFYGNNGSGKSTILNVIAEKLKLSRSAPFNRTPLMEEYCARCRARMHDARPLPSDSRIITSDDVFDFLLDRRALNEGIDRRREELFDEYYATRREHFQMRSLEDFAELKRRNEAKRLTKSVYTARRLPKETVGKSNGESAFLYFTQQIGEGALYLLDEPENSLSATLQQQLAGFIEEAVRFFDCQLIISTHSPFLLSLRGARIYDLDACPVKERPWTELENVRAYYEFFKEHDAEF